MRSSSKCMRIAFISDEKIIYSCDSNIKSPEEISYYSCEFIDNDIKTKCKSCNLPCIVKGKTSKKRGVDLSKYKVGNGDYSKESVIANYIKEFADKSIGGRGVDIEKFKLIYSIISKKKR